MKIEYSEGRERKVLTGDSMVECIKNIANTEQRRFALRYMPVNVTPETFTRLMRDSFDWANVRIFGDRQIANAA